MKLRKMIYAAVCLALAYVLPFITGQMQQIGNMLCPMHLPVLICGFLCGWPWGLAVGFAAPLLRCLTLGMPPVAIAVPMAFELAAYGFTAGLAYKLLPKKRVYIYASLLAAMVAGRLVWGLVKLLWVGLDANAFTLKMFWMGAVANAAPGIVIQILVVPMLMMALEKTVREC